MAGVFFRLFYVHHQPGVCGQRGGLPSRFLIRIDHAELFPLITQLSSSSGLFRHAPIFVLQLLRTSGVVVRYNRKLWIGIGRKSGVLS